MAAAPSALASNRGLGAVAKRLVHHTWPGSFQRGSKEDPKRILRGFKEDPFKEDLGGSCKEACASYVTRILPKRILRGFKEDPFKEDLGGSCKEACASYVTRILPKRILRGSKEDPFKEDLGGVAKKLLHHTWPGSFQKYRMCVCLFSQPWQLVMMLNSKPLP